MSANKKIITVIGGTGAQGRPVIEALVAAPSLFSVRVLTRDANHELAKELVAKYGVEIVEGSVLDDAAVAKAFKGAYGAFVNIDTFTVGEVAELHAGVRAYELACAAGVEHFVWSSLDYKLKDNKYDDRYGAPHYNVKGRVWEFIKSQAKDGDMLCSLLITGPYTESLGSIYAPIGQRKSDGAVVFALPWGAPEANLRFPFISLPDIAFFARWIFDNPPSKGTVKEVPIMSQFISGPELAQAFQNATGQRAVYVPQTIEEYVASLPFKDMPLNADDKSPDLKKWTWGQFFTTSMRQWIEPEQLLRDRDMAWIKSIHPGTLSVEQWMKATGYNGIPGKNPLKRWEAARPQRLGLEHLLE
ncbi:NAD(P)-binding protein [Exidia glandulosa HHB12029]|uniref:NAD(P)-binding protein n=1 Tax=Exidia glandulosa HHB12029 TaxID=1314781 RepID=A0A165Z339_EXIGL|nr:NAD(P)-binding protein [Exidia glandulosa HHB12029]